MELNYESYEEMVNNVYAAWCDMVLIELLELVSGYITVSVQRDYMMINVINGALGWHCEFPVGKFVGDRFPLNQVVTIITKKYRRYVLSEYFN